MRNVWVWGHNPGQRYVKDVIALVGNAPKSLTPYPAIIAPWQSSDDTGLVKKRRELTADVDGRRYLGGASVERLPLANRQMAVGRLDEASPMYQALAQMSLIHTGIAKDGEIPEVILTTALPVGWRTETAEQAMKEHIQRGLRGKVKIIGLHVQSEPNAVVSYELLDDLGQFRKDQLYLTKGLVCVGDLGGGTLNRSVLEDLRPLPGQSRSPLLGSRQVVEALMQISGMEYLDAERRIEAALKQPGSDSVCDALLEQYRERVVAELQQAWSGLAPVAYLFAGGTTHWVGDALTRAFGLKARIVKKPQMAIAVGLFRYGQLKAVKAQRGASGTA